MCILHRVKKVKFMAINFRSRTNVKDFMQTQILRFCKGTAKFSSLPMLKYLLNQHIFSLQRKKYQYCGLNLKQIKHKRSENLFSFFLLNCVHILLGQEKLNEKQLKIQWTQHLSKSPV